MLIVVLVIAQLAAPEDASARVADALARASALVATADQLAFELKFDLAIDRYQEALALFDAGAAGLSDFTPVAACEIHLGGAWFARHKSELGKAAFARALALGTMADIDRMMFNPEVIGAYRQIAKQLARAPKGGLTVAGYPDGAAITIDGRSVGAMPLSTRDLIAGTHWLVARKREYQTFVTQVAVPSGTTQAISVFLKSVAAPSARPVAHVPVPVSAAVAPHTNPWLAVAPFGIGQFAEHRPLAGGVFLVAEAALLATNIATAAVALPDRTPLGYRNASRDSALQIVNLAAFGLLIATVVGGGIEGWVQRNHE